MADMIPYVVQQGDFLTAIAHRFGVSAKELWNDPANSELKARRPNPEILEPGDILQIPAGAKANSMNANTSNAYQGSLVTVKIKLKLLGPDGQPLAGKKFWVDSATDPTGTTTGAGIAEISLPVHTTHIALHIEDCDDIYQFNIGHLDPVTSENGVRQRLLHLGYLLENSPTLSPQQLQEAITRFQQNNNLKVTGHCDSDTESKLTSLHGS